MNDKLKHQTLALAGMLQAAELINELAVHGNYNARAFKTSIDSLYFLEASTVESIYGYEDNDPASHQGLLLGLSTLEKVLAPTKPPVKKTSLHYFFNMIHLERKFMGRPELMDKLNKIIQKLTNYAEFKEDKEHPNLLADLADAYTALLSNFNFQVLVRGNQHYLSQRDNLNKIRALLLAGVRSAVLWRQLGGRRWNLLLRRNKILQMVRGLLG